MVEHETAQNCVELIILERDRLDQASLKADVRAGPDSLAAGHIDHLRGGVDARDLPSRPDESAGDQCHSPWAAANIQYAMSWLYGSGLEQPPPDSLFLPEKQQLQQKIVL